MAGEAEIDTRRLPPVRGIAPRTACDWRNDVIFCALIATLVLTAYLLPALRGKPLYGTPEARIAVAAREMILSGDYLVPTVGGEPRLNKPPLPYWITAGLAQLIDRGEGPTLSVMSRAAEAASAFATALAVFMVALYGCAVFGRAAGVLVALVLSLSVITAKFAWLGCGDTALMATCAGMFCAAAWMVSVPRPGLFCALGLGVALGLALLSKGHIPLLLLAAPLLAEVLIRRKFSGRKVLLFALALLIAAAIAVPWYVAVSERRPETASVMQNEMTEAFAPTGHLQNDQPVYYIYKLAGGLLPWTPLLLLAWLFYIFSVRKRLDTQNEHLMLAAENLRFFTLTFVLGFIGFYLVRKQQEHYLLPLLPPLALASGFVLSRFKTPGGTAEEKLAWSQVLIGLAGAVAMATLPLWPIDHLAQSAENAAEMRAVLLRLGWVLTGAAGLAFLLLHLYLARQCVEGRPLRVGIALAAAAYAGVVTWSIYSSSQKPGADDLPAACMQMRQQLEKFGPDVKVYAVGASEPLLVFYLERPVLTVKDHLRHEPQGVVGPDAPQRVLVATRKGLEKHDLASYLPDSTDQFFLVPLPKEIDWPAKFQALRLGHTAAGE